LNVSPTEAAASLETKSGADIDVRTLTDGGQTAEAVAGWIAEFVGGAQRTLDLAQYDFHLGEATSPIVAAAFRDAVARGVAIRIVYDVDSGIPVPVPPPPEPDTRFIASLGVQSRAVAGVPDLMHHKYAVRDGTTVWTGSLNWTDDSFSRQENVVVIVQSELLARAFTLNFEELWTKDAVAQTGRVEPREVDVGDVELRPWFTPGFGEELAHRVARAIGRAKRRVRLLSPVLTSGPVLGTLAEAAHDGRVDLAGCLDATQMQEVLEQWGATGSVTWKLPLLLAIVPGRFSGKESTPWNRSGSPHDFMHAKVLVADDVVFLGSYNLSRSGETNAENVLEIEDPALAERMAAFVDEVRGRYPPLTRQFLSRPRKPTRRARHGGA
jgi:phosphatidylserine/phosphatidylglycerophosphate/cardiolipin synthase-like enzyme